jgi:hypothetical protein
MMMMMEVRLNGHEEQSASALAAELTQQRKKKKATQTAVNREHRSGKFVLNPKMCSSIAPIPRDHVLFTAVATCAWVK